MPCFAVAAVNSGNRKAALIKFIISEFDINIQLFDENIVDIFINEDVTFSEEIASQLGVLELINGIKDYKEKNLAVGSLSGGEKKKILFTLILGQASDILILDEPLAEIDMGSKDILAEVICNSNHNRIVILITHEIPAPLKDCTRVIHMKRKNGRRRYLQWLRHNGNRSLPRSLQ